MQQYIISSEKFKGNILVYYDDSGFIACVDFRPSNINQIGVDRLLKEMPRNESELPLFAEQHKTLSYIAECIDATFDMFWERYGKKINRERALENWNKMNKANREAAFLGIWPYDRYLKRVGRKKADPENYLKRELYRNEWDKIND